MLNNAFNYLLSLQAIDVKIKDLNTSTEADIQISPSNYFRKLEGIEETTIEGKEYVISKSVLDKQSFPEPKRGHRIIHSPTQHDTIGEVKPMIVMGKLFGYRVRIQ
jgi:hypothetical protein